ncbi:MAG: 6-phosphofructokinase [Verrucomicrobiales bacterium]|nr:6-phosphofructokinase [Verrucomicrobiales bacterium]
MINNTTVKRVAILCSGGDCAGMNPAVKQFTEYATARGLEPYGINMGLAGLFRGDITPLGYHDVSGIVYRGGTILGSSRFPEFHDPEIRKVAAEQLRRHQIDSLVVLGGNGSFLALECLRRECGVSVVGLPATIDNDVYGSEMALGVDTSLNVIRHCLDSIRDTASSFHRAFVVETMGRDCGYLAIITALTSGAEVCLVPEVEFDITAIENRLRGEIENGRTYLTAIVSEAVDGGAQMLTEVIESRLKMACRTTVLGHVQRGGSPTVADRLNAFEMITIAVDELLAGRESFAVLSQSGRWVPVQLIDIVARVISIPPNLLSMAHRLAN